VQSIVPSNANQESATMDMSGRFGSPFLKASDLSSERTRVTITEISDELMGNPRERKTVAYFLELEKGLVLNKTNGKTLLTAFGKNSDDWLNKVIELVVKPGQSPQGEEMDVIRIDVPQQQPSQPSDTELNRRLDEAAAPAPSRDDDIPF
jgi:hypothetical protein